MKIDHKIFGWAFVFGITACLIDVILDYLFFYKGETFLGLLITDVPPHEIYIRGLIMVSYAIFGLFMGWVYADRNEAYQELQAANQQLLASEQELQASNQQFRASNQQLQTTEEELRASCQQLEAGEQQLRAANQQLIAHEHQLESVNQQLNGANQQLEATNQQLDATNQQLASTNQQLETSNQQLEAANRQLLENETKIRRQNKFLNSVIESLGHPFYVIDAKDHSIKLANSAAHAIGLSTSSTYDLLSHKETQQGHEGNLVGVSGQILKTKRPASAEYTHAGMDGSPRHFEFHGYPIFNKQGDVEQIIEYSIDITERKEAEQALEASERSYRAIFNSTGDTILVHDMQTGAILDSNQAATEMLGYTTQEFQHIDTKDISSGQSPYSEKEAAEAIDKAIEEGSNIFEWRAKRKNGELFWIEVS
ncbi:MAG: PAS domain S-box protein, partial [Planctomycetes bacterium]|nr:PAS domain S-box protein [Planctomycetota bacterium]